ncbi:MAG: hypothetical protein Q9216_003801 [Gyalolechia sp. 2 TL-2023]
MTFAEGSEFQKTLRRVEDVQELVDQIFRDWQKVRAIFNAYSEALHKRWTKRNITKRKSLLLEAWPGMNPMHRPDFEVIRRGLRGPDHRDALMMPYINLEDLSSGKNLLNLIASRTKMCPEHFAWIDSIPFKTATTMNAVRPAAQLPKIMLLTGQKTRDTYGRLQEVEDEVDVEHTVWTGFGFQLGQGLVILEIQQKLYHFLLRCTERLLCDIDLSDLVIDGNATDAEQRPDLADATVTPDSGEWHSVSDINTQASYHLPQPFPLESLRRLAGAKRDAAEDSFWALHQDPVYFQEQLTMQIERNKEPCRKVLGTSYEAEENVLIQACINVIHDSCRDIIMWEAIAIDMTELEATKASLDVEIELSKRLPPRYEMALESFIALTYLAWSYAIRGMVLALMSSPNFLDFFDVVLAGNGEYADFEPKESTRNRWPPILKLLLDLQNPEMSIMMGALNILDEMERLMTSDESQRAMINAELATEISKLAALAQIQDALVAHQPIIQATENVDDDPMILHHMKRFEAIDELRTYLTKIPLRAHSRPITAFNYPMGKKRTLQHVEQMRRAEAKLDAFWEQVDKKFVPQTGQTIVSWMGHRLNAREIYRTEPWHPVEQKAVHLSTSVSPYQPIVDSTPSAVERYSTELRKKPKTRGQTDPSRSTFTTEPTATAATVSQTSEPPRQIFSLPSKVFRTMTAFYPASIEDRTGRKVVWKDFLHAMYTLSFRVEKRQGSEWYFEPSWRRNAPITIHEPHPSHEMRYDKIRFEANRMARKYGWGSETFHAD